MDPTIANIRQFLVEKFSAEDLEVLCADYFRDVYNDFSTGMTKSQKINLLIDYCQRFDRWANLLAALRKTRSEQFDVLFPERAAHLAQNQETAAGDTPSVSRNPQQIFISYAHADASFAHRLANDLQQRGWAVWIAPESIRPGEKWVTAIERGLDECGVFLAVLTPSAFKSSWIRSEIDSAIGLEHQGVMRLIPLYVQPCKVSSLLSTYQHISFLDQYDDGLSALLAELEQQPSRSRTSMDHGSRPQQRPRAPTWRYVAALALPTLALLAFAGTRLLSWNVPPALPATTTEPTVATVAQPELNAQPVLVSTATAAPGSAFSVLEPTSSVTPSPTPLSCDQSSPYPLASESLIRLGCAAGGFVNTRYAVTQEFEHGFMIVFDDAGNTGFQTLNKERKYYVLAADGRAWRLFFEREDVIQVTTTNPDDQYTCDKAPGKRPAESGVPWRGFGRVWCGHDDIRMAVGHVKPGADEILTTAAFQSFDNGRAFSVHGKSYVIHLNVTGNVSQETFLTGTWEPVVSTGTTAPSKPPAAESPQGPDTCNPRWFFTPRPAGCLQNYRARTAEMQVYQRGRVVYLSDVGQSFVFFDGDSWKNVGAGIDDAGTQHRDRLGEPVGARRTFQSCGGSTSSGGLTTSYIIDADTRILTWAIVASSYTPAGWDYLDDRQFLGCP